MKSGTTCKYINKKKDNKDVNSKPKTLIFIKDNLLFFFEIINCVIEKISDNQSDKFPNEASINITNNTTF